MPLVNKFQLVGAFRFEDHRGIDQVTTPKVGVVYSPSNGVDFKASWGKSFKVPTLYQTGQTSNAQLLPGFIFSPAPTRSNRSEEHTSELQSQMRTTYDFFCL